MLLGETGGERREALNVLRGLHDGSAGPQSVDIVRRALVETLMRGARRTLIAELDESLLGVRPKPSSRVAQALAS
jgi:hypothetical protein